MQNNCKRKQYSEYLHILAYHDEQKRNNRKNTGEYFKAKLFAAQTRESGSLFQQKIV